MAAVMMVMAGLVLDGEQREWVRGLGDAMLA